MQQWRDYPLPGTGQPGTIGLRIAAAGGGRERRDLLVALPPGYANTSARYPVVYMQDGQNLFDPVTSYAGDWGLAESLNQLAGEGLEAIVVGVSNRGHRRRYEYSPFRDIIHGGGGGDRYLGFVVATVKPLIDRSFRTRPQRSRTVIAGASLGGLISLYALSRHAGVFGAAGVLSPALWFADRAIFRFLEKNPPGPPSRIYLDVGTAEGNEAVRDARALREWILADGAVPDRDLRYVEEEAGTHDEETWGRRFPEALRFLVRGERAL